MGTLSGLGPEHAGPLSRLKRTEDIEFYTQIANLKPIHEKRIFKRYILEIPALAHFFDKHDRDWENFMQYEGEVNLTIVREFLAALRISSKGEVYAMVKGVRVECTEAWLNAIYGFTPPDGDDTYEFYMGKPPLSKIGIIQELIVEPNSTFKASGIPASLLYTEARIVHHILCNRFLPTTNTSSCYTHRALLTCAIVQGAPVNVGRLIVNEIKKVASKKELTNIVYPMTITALCLIQGVVPEDSNIPTPTFKLSDISRVKGSDAAPPRHHDAELDPYPGAPPYMHKFMTEMMEERGSQQRFRDHMTSRMDNQDNRIMAMEQHLARLSTFEPAPWMPNEMPPPPPGN